MTAHEPFRDSVELANYTDGEDDALVVDHPDAPLPSSTVEQVETVEQNYSRAKWMRKASRWARPWIHAADRQVAMLRPRWMDQQKSSWQESLTTLLRPRLTVGYVLFILVILYISYCYITWSPLFASKLPQYTGPHSVGTIDVEVPVQDPRSIVDAVFEVDGKPAFNLDTVLFTLYYPAVKDARSAVAKHKWFPSPISLTAEGYAIAAHFNNFFSRALFTFALWGLAGSIRIPASVDVPLLREDRRGQKQKFPVVVLSHGDVSSRTDYTAYCGELASRGVVVAAIEHRDGSCPGSLVHLPDGKRKRVLLSRADQLKPADPDKPVSNDDWRFKKLAFRDAEIQETISVLQRLDRGHGANLFERNYRGEGQDLISWESRLDFSRLVIAGHSFGATGALQALRGARKAPSNTSTGYTNPAIGGVILDPGKSSGRLNTDIDVPLLIVHSDSWSKSSTVFYGRPHFDTVRDLARDVLARCGATWFMTSLKTSHPSVTDAPLIEPLLLSWTTGATISVKDGLREYVRVTVEFLRFCRDGSRRGVLDVGVTHEEYGKDTRTPEQKEKMDGQITKFWEVHVAPPPTFARDE